MKNIIFSLFSIIVVYFFIQLGIYAKTDSQLITNNQVSDKQLAGLQNKLAKQLQQVNPDIKLSDAIVSKQLPNYAQIQIEGGPVLYMSLAGDHFFAGELYYFKNNAIVPAQNMQVSKAWQSFKNSELFSKAITFKGDTVKAYMNVFTDYSCGYCRKLHQDIDKLNQLGIAVRYFPFPRGGADTKVAKQLESAWCAKDPHQALTTLKNGNSIADNQCDNFVKKSYQIGVQLGVTGTPAVFFDSGQLISGYMSPKKYATALNIQ